MDVNSSFDVTVVCAWPDRAFVARVQAGPDCTIDEVVRRSGVLERFPEFNGQALTFGVFGRAVPLDYLVRPGDRIELLRPLLHDPKDARRMRASQKPTQSSGPARSS